MRKVRHRSAKITYPRLQVVRLCTKLQSWIFDCTACALNCHDNYIYTLFLIYT